MRALLLLALLVTPAAAEPRRFVVDAGASAVTVHVGRAGVFSFFGHEHAVVAAAFEGEVVADAEDVGRSRVSLAFRASELRVTGKGEPADDVPKVQAKMVGPEVLDVARYSSAVFRSVSVTGKATAGGSWELTLAGELTLHGQTRKVELPVHVQTAGDALTATGRLTLRQSDYGISPVSVGGVVKVKDELGIDFRIVARR